MKKLLTLLLALTLLTSSASATILPANGVHEAFEAYTGIACTPAVILCETLSVLDARGDQGGKTVETLRYSGETIPVIESWDGYAKIYYADGQKTGWVRSDYLLFDPARYLCDSATQVYAYPDFLAPRVALLDAGTMLPILTEYDAETAGWVCVSLRAAAGWIRKTPADTVDETWFRPDMLSRIAAATLLLNGAAHDLTDPAQLAELALLLVNAEDMGGPMAGCPFGATLTLSLADGSTATLELATDSCCAYRIDGRDYKYARHLKTPDSGVDNSVLFGLFGVEIGQ